MITPFDTDVFLKEENHTYWNKKTGLQYLSVSALLNHFSKKFDKEKMLPLSAKKDLVKAGNLNPTTAQIAAQVPITEKRWNSARDDSADHGTRIHKVLEDYFTTTVIAPEDKGLEPMIKAVARLFMGYHRTYNEVALAHDLYRTAGTTDKPCFRTGGAKSILDISDYKTNIKKGIQYKSDYSDYFNGPISHIEDCNFNRYALQLSLYGVMAEEQGFKIGKLFIIYVPAEAMDQPQVIPVNYLRTDALNLLKQAPEILQSIYGKAEEPIAVDQDDDF